jgi:hypothetical protein
LCLVRPLCGDLSEIGKSADVSGISVGLLKQGTKALDISCEGGLGARNATALLITVRFDHEAPIAFSARSRCAPIRARWSPTTYRAIGALQRQRLIGRT